MPVAVGTLVFAAAVLASGAAADLGATPGVAQVSVPTEGVAGSYTLERLDRSEGDLADRVRSVMHLFPDVTLDEVALKKWAQYAVDHPEEKVRFRPAPDDAPNVVVSYQARYDDLEALDLGHVRARPDLVFGPKPPVLNEGLGEQTARARMEFVLGVMETEGLVPSGSFVPASAELGVWKEFESRAPNETAEWVVEYQYSMNRVVDGLQVLDAGIRIGISRSGALSSLRITDISVHPASPVQSFSMTIADARRDLVTYEEGLHPQARVVFEQERAALVLRPDKDTGTVPPGFVFNYALRFTASSGEVSISRQKLGRVSFENGTYDQVFPVVAPN